MGCCFSIQVAQVTLIVSKFGYSSQIDFHFKRNFTSLKNYDILISGMEPGQNIYSLDPTTLQQVNSAQAEALILHNEDRFRMEISALKVAGFRVKIREAFPLVARFEVPEVLVGEPELDQLTIEKSEDDKSFTITSGKDKIEVVNSPFRMDFYSDGVLVVSANARQLMRFEATKGQLISKCPFGVFKLTKKTNKIFVRISALASKKRSNQKSSVRESK